MRGKKKRFNFFDKLIWWLNILLGAAQLISYLAAVTDPRKTWLVAFFGLAYPFLLLGNALFIVYWLLRKSRYAWLSLIVILLGWNVLRDNIGFSLSSAKPVAEGEQHRHIRVMTYNAHNFKRYGENNDIDTKSRMLQLINRQQPDVIGIQEFYARPRGAYALRDSMKKIMQSDQFYFEPFSYDTGTEAMGMAVFSRFPIVHHGIIQLSDERGSSNQCLYVDVKKSGQVFRFYSVHLQSIGFDPADYQYLQQVSKEGQTGMAPSRRIFSKLKRAFVKRSEQVFKVKAHAGQCPYPYVIAGDFNDTPASFAVTQMAKGIQNAFREKGKGFVRTYNGSFPNYQIDYIMASPQLEVGSYQVIKEKLSDHYPVCSDMVVR